MGSKGAREQFMADEDEPRTTSRGDEVTAMRPGHECCQSSNTTARLQAANGRVTADVGS